VANLPAEIHHLFEELQAKDKQLQECRAAINSRDNSLQKFIKMNGSHVQNPKEDLYAKAIRSQYQIALRLQDEKIALAQKALALVCIRLAFFAGLPIGKVTLTKMGNTD